jgi:predicted dehydrogenase
VSYRAAVIGCGRVGCGFDDDPRRTTVGTHAGAYRRVAGVELVALADVDPAKLARYGAKFDVERRYTDHRTLLAREKPDIVSICTWADSHRAILEDAVRAGVRAVFCEKPIADTLTSARAMQAVCTAQGVLLVVNHRRRFDAYHRDIADFLARGGVGRIQHVICSYVSGVANTGAHLFDALRLYAGEIAWVRGRTSVNTSPNPDDPNIDAVLGFEAGFTATALACDVKAHYVFEIVVMGTEGRLTIGSTSAETLTFETVRESGSSSEYRELSPSPAPIPDRPHEQLIDAVQNIVDVLDGRARPACTAEDGYKALEIIIALRESAARDGALVALPLGESSLRIASR